MGDRVRRGMIRSINPLALFGAVILEIVPVFLSFDPYTPLVFLVVAVIQFLLLGRVRLQAAAKGLGPLLALPAGLFVLNLFASARVPGEGSVALLGMTVASAALHRAVVLSLRSLALIMLSVGYLLVTEPQALVNALMQQLRLSPRFGFSIYVAWNTIPLLRENLKRITATHQVRLRGRPRSLLEVLMTAVTLLAGAIRHGERASLSMAARGIESERFRARTFLTESRWRGRDTLFLAAAAAFTVGATILLIRGGLFVFGLG